MLFGVCRGLDDLEAMTYAKKAGIDYFETGFGCLARFSDEAFKEGKEMLKSLSLPCVASNGFIPADLKVVGENVDYAALTDYLDIGFERAKELGVKKIIFGSGKARSFPDGFDPARAKEQLLYFISEYAAPKAKKAGCIIVMEPLRFVESSMIHTVEEGVEIARLSKADNVFGLGDLYHIYGNNDSFESIEKVKNMVRHCHIAHPSTRQYPSTEDSSDVIDIYKSFLSLVKSGACDTCSIEARTENFSEDIMGAVALLKNIDKLG